MLQHDAFENPGGADHGWLSAKHHFRVSIDENIPRTFQKIITMAHAIGDGDFMGSIILVRQVSG